MEERKKHYLADFALLLVALIWGTTFVGAKVAMDYFSPFYLTGFRFLIAAVTLSIVFNKKLRKLTRQDLTGGMVVGFMLFMALLIQTIGLQYTTPGKQAFLASIYSIYVPFLTWIIYRKRPEIHVFAAAGICILGISFLTLNESLSIGLGDSITLFSTLFYALHIITIGYFVQKTDATVLSVLQFVFGAVFSLVTALVMERPPTSIPAGGVLSLLYLALIGTCLSYTMQIAAQKHTKPAHVAIILSLEAVFGSIVSILVTGEHFTFKIIVGCVAVFTAVLMIELIPAKKEP